MWEVLEFCSVFDMSDGNVPAVIGNYVICVLAAFVLCVIVDSVYRFLVNPLLKRVTKKKCLITVE